MCGPGESLRNAFRFAKRAPAVAAVAIIILALGTGACAAIFSILYAVSYSPLPYKSPNELVVLLRSQVVTSAFEGRTASRVMPMPYVSGPDFLHWEKQSDVFSALAAGRPYEATAALGGQTERLEGYKVTPEFFKVLGVKAAAGRLFAAGDDQPGRDHVVILGPGFGTRGAWTSAVNVGGTLTLYGQNYAVIGRLPPSFRVASMSVTVGLFPKPEIFVPIPIGELEKAPAANSPLPGTLTVIGRLKGGATIAGAQVEMTTIAANLSKQYPALDAGVGVQVASMQSQQGQVPAMLSKILLAAVGFLLLIACVDIAVLILAQGARRQHEIAIRHAVGATRVKIVWQLFSESLFLALAGGACGVLIAVWIKNALVSRLPAVLVPLTRPVEINWQVMAFALVVSVAAALLFGMIPALQLSLTPSTELLKEAAHAGGGGTRSAWLRNAFVVSEVTLAFALLIVCGLLIQGIGGQVTAKPGYNPKRVLQMPVTLPAATYPSFATRESLYRKMLSRLNGSPLVNSSALEVQQGMPGAVVSADKPVTALSIKTGLMAYTVSVTPDYFRTLEIPLVRGRSFTWSDYADKPVVAIINQALASALWPKQNPVGKHITTTFPAEPLEVIGVTRNAGMMGTGIAKETTLQVYLPEVSLRTTLQVRIPGNAKGAMAAIHAMAASAGPGVQVGSPMTMEQFMAEEKKPGTYALFVLGFFGVIALLLATVGVFAVTAYSVSQRTHEIGVRVALGARPVRVLFTIMREGTKLGLYGVGIGLLVAVGLGKIIMHFLAGVTYGSIWTYLGVALLLLAVVVFACYAAARRATKVDPVAALRCE